MLPPAYFVRHGQTDWNVEGRLQGQAETDINETGRAQAERNGRRLAELIDPAGFDFVASPMRRTCHTMELVRTAMGLPADDYRVDTRLLEVHFGDWQGLTLAEVEVRYPGTTAARAADKWGFLPPGEEAESYAMLSARVRPWLDGLRQSTVCVTHGGVVRAIFHLVAGLSGEEAARMNVPQDRVLELRDGRLTWF